MTRRRTIVAVIVVLLVVVAGVVAVRVATTNGRPRPPKIVASTVVPAVNQSPVAVGPVRVNEVGVPQGWRHDRAGASAAAVSAVRSTGDIARAGFITRADKIRALTTVAYAPTLVSLSATQLAEMTVELGDAKVAPQDLIWSEIPLTAHIVTADAGTARVQVWSVLVVAVPNVGAPRQVWRTVTIDLAWESADWKVNGWVSQSGPTPLLDVTSSVASTVEIADVTAWPAATVGGG
jgi:hypothetical protein